MIVNGNHIIRTVWEWFKTLNQEDLNDKMRGIFMSH